MFTHKDYRNVEFYQDELRQQADQCRLLQGNCFEPEMKTFNSRRWIMIGLAIVLMVVMLFAGYQSAFAQERVDPGQGEPFHDAMLAYRVGIYFLNKGDYDRAVEKLSEAVTQMPEWAFQVEPGYADMYWTLGEALEGAGRYREALTNYRAFHRWVGDEAAPWTFAKVEELQAQVDELLIEDTRV
jgi:tetratricopeptide (TPR) repeat protein